jgi:hypothetical protein
MCEVLLGADAQYVIGSRLVTTPGELFEGLVNVITWFHPFGALLVGGLVVLLAKRVARREPLVVPTQARRCCRLVALRLGGRRVAQLAPRSARIARVRHAIDLA